MRGLFFSVTIHTLILGGIFYLTKDDLSGYLSVRAVQMMPQLRPKGIPAILDIDAEPVERSKITNTNVVPTNIQPAGPVNGSEDGDEFFNAEGYGSMIDVEEGGTPMVPINIPYPPEASRLGVEGRVLLAVWIDERGAVQHVKVLKTTDEVLSKAASAAVKKTPFRPAKIAGKVRAIQIQLPIKFRLE